MISGEELAVSENSVLPILSSSERLGMLDARKQCQAVEADHGKLS